MQGLLMLMRVVAEDEGLLYQTSDGYPVEVTTGYDISDGCRIPFLGLCQLWPNRRDNESWLGSAMVDALVRLNIKGAHGPTRMFLSTDDLVPWLTCGPQQTVEKKLRDALRDPVITVKPNGRTVFRYMDTQAEPPRFVGLTLPAVPDEVDTVLLPYNPSGITAFDKTLEEHLLHLDQLFQRISEYGITLSPSKSFIEYPCATLLGQRVNAFGLGSTQERTKALTEMPFPRTLKDLEHWIGATGFLQSTRLFILRTAASGRHRPSV
ncbi:uncharacterized protein BKCO1_7500025 [Diplodia corticola]|uniref:Putative transposable element n=1 Tax=Diplodia corticola TaxID=236234 RepID=A0A1J9RB85_9PEZI|nr:uncharacterized protein BKCO1_7500025 [Diplodia corticola]OJD29691.1 putative transposable element [Diplodia corticola]